MSGRYTKGQTVWVQHPIEGRVQVTHLAPIVWSNYPYTTYRASSADSFTTIASKAYGSAEDYWFVAAMNPQIACPDDLAAGDIVHIPTGKLW